LFAILSAAVYTDLRRRLIYDWITLPGIGFFLLHAAFFQQERLIGCLVGMCVLGGLSFLMAVISRGQIGGGDIKLLSLIGVALGWQAGMIAFAASYFLAGAVALCLLLFRKRDGNARELPMAPFYAIGTGLVYLFPFMLNGQMS
jgi:leader peptidase (prepilin peptidase)/N-methyltransferase